MRTQTGAISDILNGASAFSWHTWAYFDTLTQTADSDNRICHFLINSTSGSGFIACIDANGSPDNLRIYARSQTSDGLQTASAGTINTGQWHSLGCVVDIANDAIRIYVDGTQVANTSVTFGATTYTDGTPSANDAIGGAVPAQHTTARQIDGRLAEMSLWMTDIGTSGFASLANRVPPSRINYPGIYLPLLGVGTPEPCVVGSGILGTITGTVGIGDHVPVAPAFGFNNVLSFPTASGSFTLTADSASYTETVQDATLQHDKILSAEATSYTETGQDATLRHNKVLVAAADSYLWTGQDATLTYTPSGSTYTLVAEATSYTETGIAATLQHDKILSLDSASYTETGLDASLEYGRNLQALLGTYTQTGQDVTFKRTYVLSCTPASYTSSGKDVDLTYSGAPVAAATTVGTSLTPEQFRRLERKQMEEQKRARMIALDDDEVLTFL